MKVRREWILVKTPNNIDAYTNETISNNTILQNKGKRQMVLNLTNEVKTVSRWFRVKHEILKKFPKLTALIDFLP